MIIWRTDMSVLTRMSSPKLVLGISYMLESVRGLFFFMKYLYFHVASPGLFRINRSSIFFRLDIASSIFFIAWSFVAILQSSPVRTAASTKTPKGLTTMPIFSSAYESNILFGKVASLWTSESPSLSVNYFLVIWNISSDTEGQCPLAQTVTVLVIPTIHPPIPNFIS